MRLIKSFINFFQRGNSVRRKVIGAHVTLILAFLCSDLFERLLTKKENVYTVQLVSTSVAAGMQPSTPQPKPPVKANPANKPKPPVKTPDKPKPPVKTKTPDKPKPPVKTKTPDKPKPPVKTKTPPKPRRKIRTAEDIRREMSKSRRKQPPKRDLSKLLKEEKIDTKSLKNRLSKAMGKVSVKQSQKAGSSRSSYNYSSYHSQVYSVLYDLWRQPDISRRLEATVELVIGRNGRLISKKMTDGSGNTIMDNSIRGMLNKLTRLPALPHTSTDDKLLVTVTFVLGD